ncbi:MAG: VTT domain-containing protein [Candidatus Paceibacterota bacterium]|jgi:membrane-associated protein
MIDGIFSSETLIYLIKITGYLGIFATIFAETGLLIGFIFPGDSLLFTAGFLASQGFFNIYFLCLIIFVAAVVGDSVGYAFGLKTGPKIFKREDSLFFHKQNLIRAQNFYEKYGALTIVWARFIPVIRTFAPIVAGIGKMNYKKFVFFNIIGGFFWSVSITFAGYYLPKVFPEIDKYLTLLIFLIIFISLLPPVIQFLKELKKNTH